MPRIPRAEPQTSTRIADMPNLVGDGWTAPGKAMQQLGAGIQKLGAGIDAFADKQEAQADQEELLAAKIDALKTKNGYDMEEIDYQSKYDGDGKDYHVGRLESWGARVSGLMDKYANARPKTRQFLAMWGAETTGHVGKSAAQFGRQRWVETLEANTESAGIGEIAKLETPEAAERYKADPEAFKTDLDTATKVLDGILREYPGAPHVKRKLANTFAAQLKALIGKAPTEAAIEAVRERVKSLSEQPAEGVAPGGAPGPGSSLEILPAPLQRTVGTPRSAKVAGVVLHQTWGSDTMEGNGAWSNKKGTGANYYIGKDGKVFQWAPDDVAMGHVGKGRGHENNARPDFTNDNTIGIEIMTRANERPNAKQIEVARALTLELAKKHGFSPEKDVFGHGELTDPRHRRSDEAIEAVEAIRKGGAVAAAAPASGGIKTTLSAYAPRKGGDAMEGGYASSRPGPDGKAEVRTLDDVASGRSEYVTVAGDPKFYGKTYTIPSIDYIDASGNKKTLTNVKAVVHDTGSAFKGKPEGRFDVAIARDVDDKTMAANHDAWKKAGVEFVPERQPPPVAERAAFGRNKLAALPSQTANDASPPGVSRETGKIPGAAAPQVAQSGQPSFMRTELLKDLMPQLQQLEAKFKAEVLHDVKGLVGRANEGTLPSEQERIILERRLAKLGDPEMRAAYDEIMTRATMLRALKVLPPDVLAAKRAEAQFKAAQSGATEDAKKYAHAIDTLHDNMVSTLKKNPYEWAEKSGLMPPVPEITVETFSPELLDARAGMASEIGRIFGEQYVQYLKPEEVPVVKAIFEQGGDKAVAAAGMVVEKYGDKAPAFFKELSKDAPEGAMLGYLVISKSEPRIMRELADAMREKGMLKDSERHSPAYHLAEGIITDKVGKLFPKLDAAVQKRAIDTALTLYDFRVRHSGKKAPEAKAPDEAILVQAYRDVIGENKFQGATYGGFTDRAGGGKQAPIPVPSHVRPDKFRDLLGSIRNSDFAWVPAGETGGMAAPAEPGQKDVERADDGGWRFYEKGKAPAPAVAAKPAGEDAAAAEAVTQSSAAMSLIYGKQDVAPEQIGGPLDYKNRPMKWSSIVNRGSFVAVGNGQYWIAMDDPNGPDPKFVQKPDGSPWVFDLNRMEPILRRRMPEAFRPF